MKTWIFIFAILLLSLNVNLAFADDDGPSNNEEASSYLKNIVRHGSVVPYSDNTECPNLATEKGDIWSRLKGNDVQAVKGTPPDSAP